MNLRKHIIQTVSKILSAAMRFPLMTLSAMAAFVFVLIYFHFYQHFSVARRQWIFVAYECIVGISLYLAFALFSEKYKVDIGKRIGFWLLGICILGLHYYALPNWAINIDATYFLRFFIFWVIFTLLVSFVLFYKDEEKVGFWQFNQYIFIQFFLSTAFTIVFWVGVASALYAIEILFKMHIADEYYIDLFALFVVVANTLFFAASIPKDFNWFMEPQSFRKPLRIFIQYVLLPLLLIYYVILLIYLSQIALSGVLPNGWVALPIIIFSSLGSLTYFLAYPISYEKEHTSIRFFVKYFFYFLLPVLTLLFAALLTRIFTYGLTEYRYLALVLGLWFLIIAVYTLVKRKTSLVLFPVSLFLLLFMGSIGPWGMYQLSARSQFLRLSKMLRTENLIEDKVLSVEKLQANITDSLAAEIGSINKYLFYREKINLVYPILAEHEKTQIDSIKTSSNKIYAFNDFLKRTFSLPAKEQLPDYRRFHFYVQNDDQFSLDIGPYKTIKSYQFDDFRGYDDSLFFIKNDTLCFVAHDTLLYGLYPYLDSLTAYYFANPNMVNHPFDDFVNIPTTIEKMRFKDAQSKTQIVFKELVLRKNSDSSIFLENARFYFFK